MGQAWALAIHRDAPELAGLETHLAIMPKVINEHRASVVVVDPMTNMTQAGSRLEANRMLLRLVDHLKATKTTALFTTLTHGGNAIEGTETEVSSIMDTWLLLRDLEVSGERNRVMYVLKSRGMAHSNQVREFRLTERGIELLDVYIGPGGVLTGSVRLAQEAADAEEEATRRDEIATREVALERKRAALQAQIRSLEAELAAEEADLHRVRTAEQRRNDRSAIARERLLESRSADNRARTRRSSIQQRSAED